MHLSCLPLDGKRAQLLTLPLDGEKTQLPMLALDGEKIVMEFGKKSSFSANVS